MSVLARAVCSRSTVLRSLAPIGSRALATLSLRFERHHHQQQQRRWGFSTFGKALLCAGGLYLGYQWLADRFTKREAEACGIVAYVGTEPAVKYLIEGLAVLQNRGYDSAGMVTLNADRSMTISKHANTMNSDSVEQLKQDAAKSHAPNTIGMAHTRWATQGGKTDENAHPHTDAKNRIAVVHNGVIENYSKLKEELEKKGVKFRSETDTEVISQMIGVYLDEKVPLVDAVKKTLARLEGTWGLVVMAKENPDQLIAARNGSPLMVGIGNNCMFVASELAAFSRHTQQYISLNDGEVAVVKRTGGSLDLTRVEKAALEPVENSPKPFPHWTLKEIMEQPQAIARTLNFGGRLVEDGQINLGGLQENANLLLGIQNLVVSGVGSSYHASMYGTRLLRALKCFNSVSYMDSSEVVPDTFFGAGSGLLVLSQSGDTKDSVRAVSVAEALGVPRFSIVNQVGSQIARMTKCGVYLNAGREYGVVATKAFTTQVATLALVASWFAQNRAVAAGLPMLPVTLSTRTGPAVPEPAVTAASKNAPKGGVEQRRTELLEAIHKLPTYTGMTLNTREKCKAIAAKLKGKEHLFILGKGYAEPIAYEGAFKIKELASVHAEGYGGGALKHGPFALLDKGVPVVMIILEDQHAELMRIAAAEVKARGAHNIIITDNPKLAAGLAEDVISVPSNGPLTALLTVIPLQLLAYELALAKGLNPDKPRHLAKSVTVD